VLLIVLVTSLKCLNAQNLLTNDFLYFGTDVFLPTLKQKNDFKLSASNSVYFAHSLKNYKVAFSPKNNIGVKLNFRNGNGLITERLTINSIYKINELEGSVGLYKLKMYNLENFRRKGRKYERKVWRNNYRTEKGKKPKFLREPGLLLNVYLGYGFAKLDGNKNIAVTSGFDIDYFNVETLITNVERLNLDASLQLINLKRTVWSYNIRFSAINFLKFNQNNLDSDLLASIDLVKIKDPFFAIENNFKLAVEYNYFNWYLKFNDVLGNKFFKTELENYYQIIYNGAFVIGITLNLDNFKN